MMAQGFTPSVFDRLTAKLADDGPAWSLEQYKDAVARDLEALLNTRAALPDALLDAYPDLGSSLINYGLIDFAGLCMTSDEDRKKICEAVKLAIESHEPRLHAVGAALQVVRSGTINRVDFVISALLKTVSIEAPVHFDAMLEASTQQYSIRKASNAQKSGA